MNGVIVLDKQQGPPANKVLNQLKRLLGRPKMGFLGTLDPLATGVLPVFCGKATKLIHEFEGLEKTYRVTVRLGQRTDTFDAEGTVIEERPLDGLMPERVREALAGFEGNSEQAVPAFSAVKVGGVPAYRLARAGQAVPERRRQVLLKDLTVEAIYLPELVFTVTCSAGTYMRSLAEDLGAVLGVGGHVTALRRLACGNLFTLENSVTVVSIAKDVESGQDGFLLDPAQFLTQHHALTLQPSSEEAVRQGRAVDLSGESRGLQPLDKVKALRAEGTLIAVGVVVQSDGGLEFQPGKVLV